MTMKRRNSGLIVGQDYKDPGPPLRTFRCHKGHSYEATRAMTLSLGEEDGRQIMETGPLCPWCFRQFADRAFGAVDVTDEEPAPTPNRAERRGKGKRAPEVRLGLSAVNMQPGAHRRGSP